MNQRELDEAVAQILKEEIDEAVVQDSARRVFAQVFDSTFIAAERVEKIRGCQDVQLLLSSYRSGTLSKERTMLVEDHVLGCADCRRIFHPAVRNIEEHRVHKQPGRSRVAGWTLAAALAAGVAIGVTGANRGVLPWQHKLEATVESVQGSLYRMTNAGASLMEVGAIIRNADELRTAKGSRATLRLSGGARVEIAERSDMTVEAAWHGTDVNLERGRMIVQSGDVAQQKVFLISGEIVIPVHTTVLALDHGSKGSRVSVAKGSAELQHGRLTNTLLAGQQFSTSYAVYNVPIASEFAWSQDAGQYAALLNELSTLQKSLQAIPSPGLRYSSKLAAYLPANTVVYAAIPNLGATLTQAKQMFDSQLAQSEVLRNWWQQQPVARNGEFDRLLNQISSVSGYLGNEIVLAMMSGGSGRQGDPVFLAQIQQPGLADYLKTSLPIHSGVHFVGSSGASDGIKEGGLFVRIDDNLLVVSSSSAAVQSAVNGGFASTPLFGHVQEIYNHGAGYFVAADLEQIFGKSVNNSMASVPTGFNNAKFVVLERQDILGTTETRAVLSFDGARQGMSSWLASPGPAGSLDFISPDAAIAASVVMKNPRAIMQELISYASSGSAGFAQSLSEFQNRAGINLVDDLAAPLGSDATFALDDPGLPLSAWKVAIEVYDPDKLQQTLSTLIDRFNQQAGSASVGTLQLTSHQMNGLLVYSVSSSKAPDLAIYYTFVDGYWLAGGSEANLLATIQNKRAGRTLTASSSFRAKLPPDGYTNFSAMLYQNLSSTLGPLAEQLKNSSAITAQQRKSVSALLLSSGPGLICLYGDSDRITAASTGSFLGLDLSALAGVYQGKPVTPLIASNTSLFQPKVSKPN